MPVTLQQIDAQLEQACALHAATLETVELLINGALQADARTRGTIVARLNGYTREIEALQNVARDIVGNGKASETALRVLSASGASAREIAVTTLDAAADAQVPHRIGPRNDASAAPLVASGDCF